VLIAARYAILALSPPRRDIEQMSTAVSGWDGETAKDASLGSEITLDLSSSKTIPRRARHGEPRWLALAIWDTASRGAAIDGIAIVASSLASHAFQILVLAVRRL